MRGTYTATYLQTLAASFSKPRGMGLLDVGKGFDLIVGTSTGGIIACALAQGVPLADVISLYRDCGPKIFRRRIPGIVWLWWDVLRRPNALKLGTESLTEALTSRLGSGTLGEVYARRRIALAITAVDMGQHRGWVFKTPHLPSTNHRDDGYRLVDVCLATSAAPVFRSLAAIDHPDSKDPNSYDVFVDGGLWANNPVFAALIESLEMTEDGDEIEIFCLGTCPAPAGENINKSDVDRGLLKWRFGASAANLSVDVQQYQYDRMAGMLSKHIRRKCTIIRFPSDPVPHQLASFMELDDARPDAIRALDTLARSAANNTFGKCSREVEPDARTISRLFMSMPEAEATDASSHTSTGSLPNQLSGTV